jgi:hypothetical protein
MKREREREREYICAIRLCTLLMPYIFTTLFIFSFALSAKHATMLAK